MSAAAEDGIPTESSPGARTLREIAEPFRALDSFEAEFVQRQSWVGMDEDLVYKGTLYLLRPNRFRIQYDEPKGHLQISDGEQVWTYVPENGQALLTRLGEGDARGDFLLRILEESQAEPQIQSDLVDDEPARVLTLIPPAGLDLSRVRIWTREGSSAILQYELTEASGNRTSYRLLRVRENPKLDPSLFRFEPPAGVPVVEVGR